MCRLNFVSTGWNVSRPVSSLSDSFIRSFVLFQHLFMSLPRLMFLVIALVVLTILVGIFLGQHIFYVCVNQTTNERHKAEILMNQPVIEPHCENSGAHIQTKNPKHPTRTGVQKGYRPYDQGVFGNLFEVFLPSGFLSRVKLKGK